MDYNSKILDLKRTAAQEGGKSTLLSGYGALGSILGGLGLSALGAPAAVATAVPAAIFGVSRAMSMLPTFRAAKAGTTSAVLSSQTPRMTGEMAALKILNANKASEVKALQEAASQAKNVRGMLPTAAAIGIGAPTVMGVGHRLTTKEEDKEKKASMTAATLAGLASAGLLFGGTAMAMRGSNQGFEEGNKTVNEMQNELDVTRADHQALNEAAENLKPQAHGFGSLKHPGTWAAAAAIPYLGYKAYNWVSGDKDKEKKAFVEKLAADVSSAIAKKVQGNPGIMSKIDKWLSTSFWSPFNFWTRAIGAGGSVGNLQEAFKNNTTSIPRMMGAATVPNMLNHAAGGAGAMVGAHLGEGMRIPGGEVASNIANAAVDTVNPMLHSADSTLHSVVPTSEYLGDYQHIPELSHLGHDGSALGGAIGFLAGNLLGSIPATIAGAKTRGFLDKTYGSTKGNLSDTVNTTLFGSH